MLEKVKSNLTEQEQSSVSYRQKLLSTLEKKLVKAEKVKTEQIKEIKTKLTDKQFRFDELKYKRSKHER